MFTFSLTAGTAYFQAIVDQADEFPKVLQDAVDWMEQKELGSKYSYSILTDGYVLEMVYMYQFNFLCITIIWGVCNTKYKPCFSGLLVM